MPPPKDQIKYEEWKKKQSLSHKGKYLSAETRFKMSLSHKGKNHPLYGKHHSEKSKLKMSIIKKGKHYSPKTEFKKGHKHSEETRKKMGLTRKGKKRPPFSEEWKKNMGLAHKGKKFSEEKRLRMRLIYRKGMLGKHHSEEAKRKIGLASKGKQSWMKGKHHTEKARKKISLAHQGEKSYRWKGGISFEPYTLDFNKEFKNSIRKRDNFCCIICNKLQEELGYLLHIHHIDYNKLNSFPQNCISLCRKHHAETNINREHWTRFFQSLLKERYNYEYKEDQKIVLDFNN